MNPVQTWGDAISGSLVELWMRFVSFLPSLVGALLVFFLGLVAAIALGKAAEKIISVLKVDQVLDRMKVGEKFKGTGLHLSIAKFFGELVKWFLILVFLMASTDIIGLDQVTDFLNSIILYIPNLVVATIILAIAFLLGNFVYDVVRHSTKAAGVMSATLLATITKWAIVIVGLLAAIEQLGIAVSLINTIFIGVIAALSLAAGLAFGLGGREEAAMILRKLREDISEKNNG
jgi:hypothetical protein